MKTTKRKGNALFFTLKSILYYYYFIVKGAKKCQTKLQNFENPNRPTMIVLPFFLPFLYMFVYM